jgi:hypothetical protein
MGSRELFAQAGFEPRSSWSLPPEWLGLQAGAMASALVSVLFALNSLSFFLSLKT